jgi:hypothetical protein
MSPTVISPATTPAAARHIIADTPSATMVVCPRLSTASVLRLITDAFSSACRFSS